MRQIMAFLGAHLPRRLALIAARWGKGPSALVWQPEPPARGDPATARRLAAGVLLFDGRLVETTDAVPWDIPPPDRTWSEYLHGHGWLDDAAAADAATWRHLAEWAWTWIERHGAGTGPGWRPDLVARRLTRQIAYSVRLLSGQPPARSRLFFRALGLQVRYLDWRWRETRPGVARIEALAGLVYAQLGLEGRGKGAARAIRTLGETAAEVILPDGSVASRSPEDLARAVILLDWAAQGIEDAGLRPATAHRAALHRAVPALQALRHGDGSLARFHGGRAGHGLGLDRVVARHAARGLAAPPNGPVMGYVRLEAGPGLVLVDGARPPRAPHRQSAHASALGIEYSYGGQALVVNAGPGHGFGARMARAARRAPSHSTVMVAETCPATLRPADGDDDPGAPEAMAIRGAVWADVSRDAGGVWALAESLQYLTDFGLTVERRLHLAPDGARLAGEDTVLATTAEARALILALYPPDGPACPIAARFLLHPDVEAQMALAGRAVALTLPGGDRWLVRSDAETLRLDPARYFDETRPKPRATQQIVASAALIEYWGRITWSIERVPA